ncbi:hypothetical protein STEG23_036364, partial [Scotinomys teguina]
MLGLGQSCRFHGEKHSHQGLQKKKEGQTAAFSQRVTSMREKDRVISPALLPPFYTALEPRFTHLS